MEFNSPEESPVTKRSLEQRCYKIGYQTVLASGATEGDDALLQALDAQAAALAAAVHRAPFEARDQRRVTRLKTLDETLKRRIVERDRAAVEAAASQKRLAELGMRLTPTRVSPIFRYAATLGLTVSIAPTFHDLVTGLDPVLKWLIAALCALGVSLLLVHGILPVEETEISTKGELKR